MFSSRVLSLLLICLLIFTRFVKLDWGDGYFFHPDEGNMARSVSQLTVDNLDPHFYAYGQFPLYLAFFTGRLILAANPDFSQAVFLLRFYSALFSVLAIIVFYLWSKTLKINRFLPLIFLSLLIFNPGLIQQSHFGTTESILIFVFAANLFISSLILSRHRYFFCFLLAILVNAVGLASKNSSLVLFAPILLAFFISRQIIYLILFPLLSFSLFFFLSPYNFLSRPEALSTFRYEASVATGASPVFYTRQFLATQPYLFQFQKVFPYTSGLTVFLLFFPSLLSLPKLKKSKTSFYPLLIAFISVLSYFTYFGQLFTKWTRFMAPIFFIFPLVVSLFLSQLKSKFVWPLLFLCLVPGLFFLTLYLKPDLRLVASQDLNLLPVNSTILSEAGNILNLPLTNTRELNVKHIDFYGLDDNPALVDQLYSTVNQSDYILIPSRRIFKNQSNPDFPESQRYYQQLFSGQLGFNPVSTWQPTNSFILDPEQAEETFSVFDHPTIRLYERQN